jgi:hypothetical protein
MYDLGDQESADHKKYIYAQISVWKKTKVKEDNRHYGNGPHTVNVLSISDHQYFLV